MEAAAIRAVAEDVASRAQHSRGNLPPSPPVGDDTLATTDSLRRQHHAASLLGTRLRDLVDHYRGGGDAYRVSLQLARLHGLLRLHLIAEDAALYPALLGSGDARTVALAREMQAETGLLAEGLERFMTRWSSSALIGSDFPAFRAELGELLDQLVARIGREDNELYPLADALAVEKADERRRAA